jgi:hypothetical protein
LVQQNLLLILILAIPAVLGGSAVGLAWEAHLGGLLFGRLAGPWFFARERADATMDPSKLRLSPTTGTSRAGPDVAEFVS